MAHRGWDGLSRRQRVRQAKAKLVAGPGGEGKVSIVTGGTHAPDGVDLRHEVRLVRSALLYADKVELVSPVAAMLAGTLAGLAQGGGFVADVQDLLGCRVDVVSARGLRPQWQHPYLFVAWKPRLIPSLLGWFRQ